MKALIVSIFLLACILVVCAQIPDTSLDNGKIIQPIYIQNIKAPEQEKNWVEKYGTLILFAGTLLTLIVSLINTDRSNKLNSTNVQLSVAENKKNLEKQLQASHENLEQQLRANQENIRHNAKANVSINNRHKWIGDFRDSISAFIANASIYATKKAAKEKVDDSLLSEVLLYKHKSILLLYPKDEMDNKLQKKIEEVVLACTSSKDDKLDDFKKLRHELIVLTQEMLYQQWEKVKNLE